MIGNEIKVSYGKAMTNKGGSFEMGHNCYTILGSSGFQYLIYQQINLLEYIKIMFHILIKICVIILELF